MTKSYFIPVLGLFLFMLSCQPVIQKKLPVLGNKYEENGQIIYHTIPDFRFTNQDSQTVNNATFKNQIYIADFFFISCPTICPKVKKQMLRLYDRYQDEPQVAFLSHTIDVRHDTIPRLKSYAQKLNISAPKWHLVTGEKDDIYGIADDYFSIARVDSLSPGGFDHSGRLILVDKLRRVRSFCNGTDPISVNEFMLDIDLLLAEYKDEASE